jgi:DNA-binding CsgD family transcriptional regulator
MLCVVSSRYDPQVLYGRDSERAKIGALLEEARSSHSGALVISGDPGVGKTALLNDARERADDMCVLHARGAESESELAFAGLHQLFRPWLAVIENLPPAQAKALRGALGLARADGDDRFLISAACLTLLSELAERRPVLCLVDDGQWLDKPSVDALLFVARRLDAEGILMLFAAREGDAERFDADGLARLRLGGLAEEDAHSLIEAAGPVTLAPEVGDLLVKQASGNPLALIELPKALAPAQLSGAEPFPEALPLSPDLERVFLDRVRRLPPEVQLLLLLVACESAGRLGPVLRSATGLGIGTGELDAAERAGLLKVRGTTIEMRHPLVRSAVYNGSTSSERRVVHLALARALDAHNEADQRAWHLAAAALAPDDLVAEELERTAERARTRSGHAAAASAFERSAELSEDDTARTRRLVAAAGSAWHAGQATRATTLVNQARPLASDPRLIADLDHIDGDISQRRGSLIVGGRTLLAGARAAAAVDTGKALEMLFDAASCGMQSGDYAIVVEAGQCASSLPRTADHEEQFLADLLVSVGSLWLGTSTANVPLMLDVLSRADDFPTPRLLAGAAMGAGTLGDEAREAELLSRAVALARASGAIDSVTLSLLAVAVAGVLAGRLSIAPEATEGLQLAKEAGLTRVASLHLAILGWLAGARGDESACLAATREVAETAATGNALAYSIAEWALSLLDLGRGQLDAAISRLESLGTAPIGLGHPLIVLASTPDLVEAYARAGRVDQAQAAFAGFACFTEAGAPAWALALAGRCRALLSDGPEAVAAYDEAIRLHTDTNRAYDRARTELLLGEHLRRHRQRVESRDHLRTALSMFEALGANSWADRARSELRASGETARRREASTLAQLTPQQLQVARFVAEGMSNKEVAAQMFLSPRTVDAHLRNVFTKLGVASRARLAQQLTLLTDDGHLQEAALSGSHSR